MLPNRHSPAAPLRAILKKLNSESISENTITEADPVSIFVYAKGLQGMGTATNEKV